MTEEKVKKVVVAATAAAVLLMIILTVVMIYQLIAIKVKSDRNKVLNEEIAKYEQMIKDADDEIDVCNAKWWLERRLRELGYYFPGDKKS